MQEGWDDLPALPQAEQRGYRAGLDYLELAPHSALRPFVKCYWALRSRGAPPVVQRVLPDGCCELILHLGDRFRQHDAGLIRVQPRLLFIGPSGRALLIEPGNEVDIVAVRFRPGGAGLLLRQPLSELRDATMSLEDLGVAFGLDLLDALSSLAAAERIALVEKLLLTRLREVVPDPLIARAQTMIMQHGGGSVIDAVARTSGVTVRQLQRRFHERVGLTPKQLARIARVQKVLRIAAEPGARLARIAVEAGYTDQSHFTRDFADIAGVTPAVYFRENHQLNDLFAADAE